MLSSHSYDGCPFILLCVSAECALFENGFAIVQVFDVATFTVEVGATDHIALCIVAEGGDHLIRLSMLDAPIKRVAFL